MLAALCPKTVGQIVVFGRGNVADCAVSNVVVGNHQTVVRNHRTAAHTAIDGDNGIGQSSRLLVVEFVRFQTQAHLAHVAVHLRIDVLYKPHTLVGKSREGYGHYQKR